MPVKKADPLEREMEAAFKPETFIDWKTAHDFIADLDRVKLTIDRLVQTGQAERAVAFYEAFLACCYEKAEEIDDSSGNLGMFAEDLFCSWIRARQASKADPRETAERLFAWMDGDDYGFCYGLEKSAVRAFNRKGLAAFAAAARGRFEAELAACGKNKRSHPYYDAPSSLRRATDILKSVYEAQGDAQAYSGLCDEMGLSPRDCERIAEVLLRRGVPKEALTWVKRGLQIERDSKWPNQSGWALSDLKRKLLSKLGNRSEAFGSAWQEFRHSPSVESYEELMRYAPRKERIAWRRKALAQAENGPLASFIRICTKTKEWERLADRVRRVKPRELEGLSHYTTEPAAKGLAKLHPDAAAGLYRGLGLRILTKKKSKYYRFALEHFESTKKCYRAAGLQMEWNQVVAEVRREHSRKYSFLPAFERIVSDKAPPSKTSFLAKARRRWNRTN